VVNRNGPSYIAIPAIVLIDRGGMNFNKRYHNEPRPVEVRARRSAFFVFVFDIEYHGSQPDRLDRVYIGPVAYSIKGCKHCIFKEPP